MVYCQLNIVYLFSLIALLQKVGLSFFTLNSLSNKIIYFFFFIEILFYE